MTESRIMERIDRTLEAIERLEALIAKREYRLRWLCCARGGEWQYDREQVLLAKNKKQLAEKIATYEKLNKKQIEA